MNGDTVLLFSGGIDSAACATFLRGSGHAVRGLFIDYGQRAAPFEKRAANDLSSLLNLPLAMVSVSPPTFFEKGEIPGRSFLGIHGGSHTAA
jgi:7-cyano-7-deazaguanine synthase